MRIGVLRKLEGGRVAFKCPGCKEWHQVRVEGIGGPIWGFDGNYEKPTFMPSILVTWSEPSNIPEEFDDTSKDKKHICHSFVKNGSILFLNDCTHDLAGQTVELTTSGN